MVFLDFPAVLLGFFSWNYCPSSDGDFLHFITWKKEYAECKTFLCPSSALISCSRDISHGLKKLKPLSNLHTKFCAINKETGSFLKSQGKKGADLNPSITSKYFEVSFLG